MGCEVSVISGSLILPSLTRHGDNTRRLVNRFGSPRGKNSVSVLMQMIPEKTEQSEAQCWK